MSSNFSSRLSELRREAGLSKTELAARLHLDRSTITNYENGLRAPDVSIICSFVILFGVSADYLLGLSDRRGIFEENALSMKENIRQVIRNDQLRVSQAIRECLAAASESRNQLRSELLCIVQNETLSEQQREAFLLSDRNIRNEYHNNKKPPENPTFSRDTK